MKIKLFSILFLMIQYLRAGTPARFDSVNGLMLATNIVNGTTYYSLQDAQNAWNTLGQFSSATVSVTTFTPSNFETNLSTCLNTSQTRFTSNTEFTLAQTKAGLREKMATFRHMLTGYSFDTASPQYIDMAQRFDWLKSYYNSLP